jgi:hypothetical protein
MDTQELERVCRAITNIFEVDNPAGDYRYVENLDDGRGKTVTHYGFITQDDSDPALSTDFDDVLSRCGMAKVLRPRDGGFKYRWNVSLTAGIVLGAGMGIGNCQ